MAGMEVRPPFEILEHTADVGLRAHGATLEELFEHAAAGLVEILGAAAHGGSKEEHEVVVEADDLAALLVRFLDELIFLVDARDARISGTEVALEGPSRVRARIRWNPSRQPLEGTELKAATFHQLSVQERGDHLEATVYFDV